MATYTSKHTGEEIDNAVTRVNKTLNSELDNKQDTLTNNTVLGRINGKTFKFDGDITIEDSGSGSGITIEKELLEDSENPVQSKVIYQALEELRGLIEGNTTSVKYIKEFKCDPTSKQVENSGDTVSVTVSWELYTNPNGSVKLKYGNEEETITSISGYKNFTVSQSTTFKLIATDGTVTETRTASISISIKQYSYYGLSQETNISQFLGQIQMNQETLPNSITINTEIGKYMWFISTNKIGKIYIGELSFTGIDSGEYTYNNRKYYWKRTTDKFTKASTTTFNIK